MNSHTVGIRNATDFSPFGVELKGRNFEVVGGGNYRFGFNGMEADNDVKGEGNSYDFGARMLDPRLGRWMTLDPQSNKQPDQSPYKAFLNNPLYWTDPNGETEYETIILVDEKTHQTTKLSVIKSDKIRTDGKFAGQNPFGTKFYNYYSYSTVTKYTRAADGSITIMKYTEILYDHGVQRKNLGWGGKIIDPLDPFELAGGFYMTGSGGQGTKYYSKNADYVGDMDAFLALMSNYSASAKMSIPTKLKENSPGWQGVSDVIDQMDIQGELIDKVWNVVDAIKNNSSNAGIQSTPNTTAKHCRPDADGTTGCTHGDADAQQVESGDTLGGTNECSSELKPKSKI